MYYYIFYIFLNSKLGLLIAFTFKKSTDHSLTSNINLIKLINIKNDSFSIKIRLIISFSRFSGAVRGVITL